MRAPLMIIVLGTLVLSVCSSWANVADYLPNDGTGLTFKFINYDVGTMYPIADTGASPYTTQAAIDAIPGQSAPLGAVAPEDSWGLLRLTEIRTTATDALVWSENSAAFGSTEVTGLFFGGHDNFLSQTTSGNTITQNIGASGFHLALWEDATPDFSAAAGPAGRSNPANSLPFYATATDGALIWTLDSMLGYESTFDTSQTREFLASYVVNTKGTLTETDDIVSGGGGFFCKTSTLTNGLGSFTGSLNSLIGEMPSGADLEINFTNTTDTTLMWDVKSNDPAYTRGIPEPATSVLMLLGLVPIGLRLRRRNSA